MCPPILIFMTMEKTAIFAADTGSALAYDADKNIVTDTSKATHLFDVMGREYKKCNNCKKWHLLDSYPVSNSKLSKDGHGSLCPGCIEKKKDKANFEAMAKLMCASSDESKVIEVPESSTPIQQMSDEVIIEEMRRRGYKGTISITREVEL